MADGYRISQLPDGSTAKATDLLEVSRADSSQSSGYKSYKINVTYLMTAIRTWPSALDFSVQPTTANGIPLVRGRDTDTSGYYVGAVGLTRGGYPYVAHGGADNMAQEIVLAEQQRSLLAGGYGGLSDVTASRSINTVFTNSSTRPLLVMARITRVSPYTAHIFVIVDNILIASAYDPDANDKGFVFIVPVGATYVIQSELSSTTIAKWAEG